MQVSIETINGKLCTVIRRPFDADKVRESLAMGVPVVAIEAGNEQLPLCLKSYNKGTCEYHCWDGDATFQETLLYTLAILPALPRYPTAKQVAKYAAEGIYLRANIWDEDELIEEDTSLVVVEGELRYDAGYAKFFDVEQTGYVLELTHAVGAEGNRVEVAIYG